MKSHLLGLAIAASLVMVHATPAVAQDVGATPATGDAAGATASPEQEGAAVGAPDQELCGARARGGDWAGGDASGSDLSTTETALDREVPVLPGENKILVFELSEATAVRVEAVGDDQGDPLVTIIDADGNEVASDDDSGGNYDSRIETQLESGTYCVATSNVNNASANMQVRLGRLEHAALTEGQGGSDFACAAPELAMLSDYPLDSAMLGEGVLAGGSITQAPAWGFTLVDETPLTITASSRAGDPVIRLLDDNGSLIAENDDADGTNSRIDRRQALPSGDYCIVVSDLNGNNNRIDITVAAFDRRADRLRRINTAEFSPLPVDDVEVRAIGTVESSLMTDIELEGVASWLQFDVPSDGLISIEALGQGNDPVIVLFDRVGRRLGEDDDGSGNLDSLLLRRVRAGPHFLAVMGVDAGAQGIVRLVIERYVRAR